MEVILEEMAHALAEKFNLDSKEVEKVLKESWGYRIASIWNVEDVLSVDDSLSEDEALEVLDTVENEFDANLGINWNAIEMAIYTCFPSRYVEKIEEDIDSLN